MNPPTFPHAASESPSGPTRDWPALRVHECFERIVDRQPADPAIVGGPGEATYAELDRRANALAWTLLIQGVAPEEPVGVLTERSGQLPLAFLAILKAGAAYVPMGADLPPQRLANMAAQCGMRFLIALDGLPVPEELSSALSTHAAPPDHPANLRITLTSTPGYEVQTHAAATSVLRPEALSAEALDRGLRRPQRRGEIDALAAILFTSGSTGQPKGVLLQHDACLNMAFGHIEAHGITPRDRILLASAPGFILGFRELCLPLLAGAASVPVSRQLLDHPAQLIEDMARQGVTVAMFTPSYLHLMRGAVPAGLRCLLTAGERPIAADARAYARQLDYWNIHGATEVCGTICMQRVDPDGEGPLASGRPFVNSSVYLLDDHGREVPRGEVGEIHVTGAGLARGYIRQPELTAARFVQTPFGRAYRTGDMGRWNSAGLLETLGRATDVVKVSGQAVALGEIEQTLLRHRLVRQAAALQHGGRLIVFVEGPGTESLSLPDWHSFLGRTLPAYMLPAQVISTRQIPVNSHGKVDRQALTELVLQHSQSPHLTTAGTRPQGETERRIAAVWELSLGVRPVPRDANFFALGGTSLLAIDVSQRLQTLGFPATPQLILTSATVAALAAALPSTPPRQQDSPTPDARQGAATAGQEDFLIASNLGLAAHGAHIRRVLSVRGPAPELDRWQSAWTQLVTRHAALRTGFFADPGGPVQWRTADPDSLTGALQLTLDHCASLTDARDTIAARTDTPFQLDQPPLARAGLVRVQDRAETLFWFVLHHAAVDGLSTRIIQEELHALLVGHPLPPAPNGVHQASQAEHTYRQSPLAARDRDYWRQTLDHHVQANDGEAFHEFTTDYRRPATSTGRPSAPVIRRLDAGVVDALTDLARLHHIGLHALLTTLLAAEARRRENRSHLIIGSAFSVRPPGAGQAVGYFVNLLPLILAAAEDDSLAAQFLATQSSLAGAIEHSRYPSGSIYREFRQRHPDARPHSRTSLFDISLTANPSRTCGDGAPLALTPRRLPGELAHLPAGLADLAFSHEPVDDQGGGLELALLWNPDVYSRATAEAWLDSFASWARWLAEDPGRADAPLPALLPDEENLLARWEPGPRRPIPTQRFHELFQSLTDHEPARLAVVHANGQQTYAELDHRANLIAQTLLRHGVTPQQPVAVLTECSPDLPAAVLGIWKAGAVYLPLALEQPPSRLAFMTRDSGAKTLLVLDGHAVPPSLAESVTHILHLDSLDWTAAVPRPEIPGSPQDLAYIIYTSGTTGMPKGVLIQHDSLLNAAQASAETFDLTPADRFSLVATPGFDASLWELSSALANGMALVPISRALRDDPWALKQYYKTHGVTVAFHTPSYLRVSKHTPFEGLRVLVVGGEAPTHDDARYHANHLAFFNACGPTECCIFYCAERTPADPDPLVPLPAGRPVRNTRVSIRRANGHPTPPGVLGELWIGGAGLARGYLNNPELTAQRFVHTPQGRMYRSGDLGRWTPDGLLEIAGRIDHQVKLHGQRLELGEIEQALLAHPSVAESVVLMDNAAEDTRALWAFVRLQDAAPQPEPADWHAWLAERLPAFMIPAAVIPVDAIPLNYCGKADHKALLQTARRHDAGTSRSAPSGPLETRVASVWEQLLGRGVAREDNFFALGGNSLLAVAMAHRLSCEMGLPVPARELFAAPTLAGFTQSLAALLAATAATSATEEPTSDLATEGQREFWVAEAAGLDTRAFNIPLLRIADQTSPSLDRWNQAWAVLVARHEALRTYFQEDADGRLRRTAVPFLPATLEFTTQPDAAAARAHARHRQSQPFAMAVPPLWRAGLIDVAGSHDRLFWLALHHSVGDGRSSGILVSELEALLRGEVLPPLTGTFGLSAAREEAYLASPACSEDARFWSTLLAAQPGQSFDESPLDYPRSTSAETGTHRFETRLDPAAAEGLHTLARRHETSLHAVILTLLALETRRRAGRDVAILGTAASIRETAAEDRLAGYYVNMLPVPCAVPPGATFGGALRQTGQALAAALQHARYPFARIYHDFWRQRPLDRHPARYPLFDVAVTENPSGSHASSSPQLRRMSILPAPPGPAGLPTSYEHTCASPGEDMVLIHEDLAGGGLLLDWHVNAAIYTANTARQWLDSLGAWALWLGQDPDRAALPLPALLPHEEAALALCEQGPAVPRPDLRFDDLFQRVLDNPDLDQGARPAVVTTGGAITYAELDRESNAIAHRLLISGVNPGVAVGVFSGRSANLPAAVLGIWKAGATYLPLAADLPFERLVFMARDAAISALIALDGLAVPPALTRHLGPPLRPEELDDTFRATYAHRPRRPSPGGDIAYVLYTSGSTGQPKGTLVSHRAFLNTILGAGETMGLSRDDRGLMFSSPSFDVSLSDIGMPLAFGASFCPVPYDILSSPKRFLEFLAELRVTVADVTPTYLRLLEGAPLPGLRLLITGGEAPLPADVEIYSRRLRYFNAYGPTENAITSTMGELRPGAITAGRPLPNTSVHILDPNLRPVPPGVAGELWLGGRGLAQGYVRRPGLTAAVFLDTPRGRLYRSGDLGRWLPSGELEILGRADDQVKLNGIRVELGEIEHAIASHPAVLQAVVLLEGSAGPNHSLHAFVHTRPDQQPPTEQGWRDYLTHRLPSYMLPSSVQEVPQIPLSNSGKVDKAALRALLNTRTRTAEVSLPAPGLETSVARLWAELLGQPEIHRHDNFFSLGGHSLLAIAITHRLEQTHGYPVPARELFAEPTLSGFARRIAELGPTAFSAASSDLATEGQREFWVAEQAGFDTRVFHMPLTLAPNGPAPAPERWTQAWAHLVARHDALRTAFAEDSGGVLRRTVLPTIDATLEISTHDTLDAAKLHIQQRQSEPLPMRQAPLWRAGLAHIGAAREPHFWLALHHSVGDGVSLGVLTEELSTLLSGGALTPIDGNFDQFAGQEEHYLAGPACRQDAAYWRALLDSISDPPPGSEGPFDEWLLDSPRPPSRTVLNTGGAHYFRVNLDAATTTALREIARAHDATLHAVMLTLMAAEVRRRTGRAGFLVGTAASTRDSASQARIVGYSVNMLPIPCRPLASEPFERLLQATQHSLAEALQHARYPFARICRDFRQDHNLAQHPSRHPLFDFAVTESPAAPQRQPHGIAPLPPPAARYELRLNAPPYDMVLAHEAQPDGQLTLLWCVNSAIYDKSTAELWINSLADWARFLASSARRPGTPLPALLPSEQQQLDAWQDGPTLTPAAPTLHQRFEQWATAQPGRPALITAAGEQTYAALNARANALAHALLQAGVARHGVVGVFTGRSTALPETVLAIWKAGASYLPLVSDLPSDRLKSIAGQARPRLLIVLDGLTPPPALLESGCPLLRPESLTIEFLADHAHSVELEGGPAGGLDPACILFTSGSTGEPKGVVLHHQGLNNLGASAAAIRGIGPHDRLSLIASPSFDAWISDLGEAFHAGAALVPFLRAELEDITLMRDTLVRRGVTVATMTPSYLRLFEQAELPSLRILMTVGEPPYPADVEHYAARLRYINGYGPTENSAASSMGVVPAQTTRIASGRPLPNTSIRILDSRQLPVPPGAAGEIWLGGIGLSLGYLNRPDLTAQSFIETPAGRLYRSGDLGRWTPSGELQILGRLDSQVKLRGQRVELAEIEHRLSAHSSVRQAAAAVETLPGGTQTLWAFVVLQPGHSAPLQPEWHAFLSQTLPSYMLPAAVLAVPVIPVTTSGKIDRAALLRLTPERESGFAATPAAPPSGAREQLIAQVWAEQLDNRPIARDDNFFDIGGNSLRAIAVVSRLRRTFHCQINDLYEHPRLANFAALCRERPEHLRTLLHSAKDHWRAYQAGLSAYEHERQSVLDPALAAYESHNLAYRQSALDERRPYHHVLLTGATGYLGSYLLRELLHEPGRQVTALVRATDAESARTRLGAVLSHYFGGERGAALLGDPRLTVLAGDLRRPDLGLDASATGLLAASLDAVFHCAANVKHYGHYDEFHTANVSATGHLLTLAARRAGHPADFHHVSTLSVCGKAPETSFRLFTEYDQIPDQLDENYYIRSKQEAERVVLEARNALPNVCIHRIGNLVFDSTGGPLQLNIEDNAFFRHISAHLRLGLVPGDSHVWPTPVDTAAHALLLLAGSAALANETHHLEHSNRGLLADFAAATGHARPCRFDEFLERLQAAITETNLDGPLTETLENYGLYQGQAPQPRARRLEILSTRTQDLLARAGLHWPPLSPTGHAALLHLAAKGAQ